MMSKLLVVFPVCAADIDRAKEIALWINESAWIDGEYACLIAADFNTPAEDIVELATLHAGSFAEVLVTQLHDSASRRDWPFPQNHMFKRVAQEVAWVHAKRFDSFFFCEPDVTPLCGNWLGIFEDAYRKSGKPFFGHIGPTRVRPPGVTATSHMNGAAIYPYNCVDLSPRFVINGGTPWDVYASEDILPACGDAGHLLVKQFKTSEFKLDSAGNVVCRQYYSRRNGEVIDNSLVEPFLAYAVLHHGCKDGTLLDLLQGNPEPVKSIEPIGFKKAAWIASIDSIPLDIKPVEPQESLVASEPVKITKRGKLLFPAPPLDDTIQVRSLKGRKRHRRMGHNKYWKPPVD